MSNALSTTLGQTLANLLRILLGTSICIIYSKGEKSFYSSHKLNCNQEIDCLLDCENCNQETGCLLDCENCNQEIGCLLENLEHKGDESHGVFKVCKGFTEIVKNLKWIA